MNKFENIKVIILPGSRDFGRCPLASRLPTSLWPLLGKPAIEHLIEHLASQGMKQATVCSNGDTRLLEESITQMNSIEVRFLNEYLPIGTAGCIREAARNSNEELLIVFPSAIISPPSINEILDEHHKTDSEMTIMFNPSTNNNGFLHDPAQIYVCQRSVLELIPDVGYCDIKETLIPAMLKTGRTIYAGKCSHGSGNFRLWTEYLEKIGSYLENTSPTLLSGYNNKKSEKVWLGTNVDIDDSARLLGSVVIGNQTKISGDVVIIGPAVIGPNVTVGKETLISNSMIWSGTDIGDNCQIKDSVIDYDTIISNNSLVESQAVATKQKNKYLNKTASILGRKLDQKDSSKQSLLNKMNSKLSGWAQHSADRFGTLHAVGAIALLFVFVWSYWPTIVDLWDIWQTSDEYSSGFLVPFLAVYILWSRRDRVVKSHIKPSMWGLVAYVGSQAFRLFGLFFMYSSAERLSLVFSIISLVLLLFGWDVLRRTSSVLLFLFLMLPLPARVHASIMLPLQKLATTSAVFCLETIGYAVTREGNIIHLNDTTVAVAEACNGLRMVTAFIIIVSLVVLIVQRPFWEKLIVVVSSLPIALLCNTIRLTITAIAFTMLTGEKWEMLFHDWGGYAMMPIALLIVVAELLLLKNLTTPPVKKDEIVVKNKQ